MRWTCEVCVLLMSDSHAKHTHAHTTSLIAPLVTSHFYPPRIHLSAQMANLGIRPFTAKLKEKRSHRLISIFPKYDAGIIEAFSQTDPIILDKNPNFLGNPNPK